MAWALIPLLWLLALLLTWMLYRRARLRTPWHLDVAAMGLLAAATLGFFWRVVAGRAWMPADGGDLVSFLFPTYRFAAGMLRSGEWPLWNPYLYTGVPHVGDIQAGFLYPPNLILFLLTPDFPYVTMQWLSIGHIWFAGTGMYLLLVRGLRVGRVPALAGAIAFMFADPFLVHFGNLNLNAVASWLPWIFWPYLIALRKGGLARQPQPDEHVTLSGSAAEAPASSAASEASHDRERNASAHKPDEHVTLSGSAAEAPASSPVSEASHTGERNLSAHASGLSATSAVAVLGWAALSGVLLAVASLAGHIQTTLFIILALGIYTAIWLWLHRQDATPGRRASLAVGSWLVCAVLTVLLIAPVLLPSLQLAGLTGRADWNYQEAAGYSLAPAQWVGWVVPGFFGRSPQYHWGAWPRVETGYVGILTLILAGAALTLRRNRNTWSWAALAGFSFLLALGINAILHGWLTLLPGFGQFRAPARLLVVTDFSLAILAATGLEAAMQPLTGTARSAFDRVWRWVAYAAAGVLLIVVPLVYVIFLLIQDREQTLVVRTSITLGAVMAFAGLLVASLLWLSARRGNWGKPRTLVWLAVGLILLDVASLGAYADLGNEDPSIGFEHPAIAAFLASQPAPFRIDTRTGIDELWQPDTALLYRLEDVTGVANPSTLADSDRYWEELGSRSSRLYDLLNARYVIARKDAPLDWDKFSLVFDGDPDLNVYLNQRAMPRAFTVGQVDAVSGHEEAWTAIHAPDFDPATKAVVEGPALQAGGSGEVHELRSGPGRLSLQVTARGAVLLVISQVWYPGWQVWVDGSPLGEPLRTDYLFQGVLLNEGVHQVELRFAPPLWRLGWILAGLTIAALVVMIVVWLPRRRLRARNSSS